MLSVADYLCLKRSLLKKIVNFHGLNLLKATPDSRISRYLRAIPHSPT